MLPYTPGIFRLDAVKYTPSWIDTLPQESFNRITRHCADVFYSAYSQFILIDEDGSSFVSIQGFETEGKSCPNEFIEYITENNIPLVVEDASSDVRFSFDPLVQKPRVRSFLGYPVRGSRSSPLGVICIADRQVRSFDEEDLRRLECLAFLAEDLLEAHKKSVGFDQPTHFNEKTCPSHLSSQLLKQAEKIGKIGAWELNLEDQALHFSDQMYVLSGLQPQEKIGIAEALEFYSINDRPRIEDAIRQAAMVGTPFDYEANFRKGDGPTRRIRCIGERLEGDDKISPRIVGVVQDISDAHHATLALQRAADYDSLTGLYNRHAFDRSLQKEIQEHRLSGMNLSLILLDLNGFKDINDTFGHIIGDVVLEELSTRIQKAVDDTAVLARWGGDEFALIPPLGSSTTQVTAIAEAVLAAIGSQVEISGQKLQLSGTAGIAWFEDGMSARELIRRADLALYEGKKRERSAAHYYHRALENRNQARQRAIAEVRTALNEDRIFAAYQPVVSLTDRSIIGFESLMRLNTRAQGRLTATDVLPALLDPLLSKDITEKMLQSVTCDMKTLQAAQPDLQFVSVNVAEADLLGRGFAEKLLFLMSSTDMPINQMSLEITETMLLVNDNGTVRSVLNELHEAGVTIALDDFDAQAIPRCLIFGTFPSIRSK